MLDAEIAEALRSGRPKQEFQVAFSLRDDLFAGHRERAAAEQEAAWTRLRQEIERATERFSADGLRRVRPRRARKAWPPVVYIAPTDTWRRFFEANPGLLAEPALETRRHYPHFLDD